MNAPIILALLVCVWAIWVARSPVSTRWMCVATAFVAASVVGVTVYWVWKVEGLFANLATVSNPAARQSVLSDALAQAYTTFVIVDGAAFMAIVALSAIMRSRQSRRLADGTA